MMVCLNKSYEYNGLHQKSTSISHMPVGYSELSTHYLSNEQETVMTLWAPHKKQISGFVRRNEAENTIMGVPILATMPNQSFSSAIDITMIDINNRLMSPKRPSESREVLDDQEEEFMALSIEVISDLIDEEPDICTIDDVKVRFE